MSLVITDAFGNRWDKQEWLEFNPAPNGEASWKTIVWLTERIAALERDLATATTDREEDLDVAMQGWNEEATQEDLLRALAILQRELKAATTLTNISKTCQESAERECAAARVDADQANARAEANAKALRDIRMRPELNPPNANLLGSYKWLTDLLDTALAPEPTREGRG